MLAFSRDRQVVRELTQQFEIVVILSAILLNYLKFKGVHLNILPFLRPQAAKMRLI